MSGIPVSKKLSHTFARKRKSVVCYVLLRIYEVVHLFRTVSKFTIKQELILLLMRALFHSGYPPEIMEKDNQVNIK